MNLITKLDGSLTLGKPVVFSHLNFGGEMARYSYETGECVLNWDLIEERARCGDHDIATAIAKLLLEARRQGHQVVAPYGFE